MVNMTLAIPEDLHEKMKQYSYIRWSEVARKSFERQITLLEKAADLVKDSKLTEDDAEILAQMVNREATKEFLDEASSRRKHPLRGTHKKQPNKKIAFREE